jgi:hypothetical protein
VNDQTTLFKYFLDSAAQGKLVRGLFITPKSNVRDILQLEMINEIDARGISDVVLHKGEVRIGDSVAYLRVAHPYLDREMRGQELHFIHGLEHVEALKDGDQIANELMYRVRRS